MSIVSGLFLHVLSDNYSTHCTYSKDRTSRLKPGSSAALVARMTADPVVASSNPSADS